MRRRLVQFRSVRIDGSLSLGKMPLARRPTTLVSWFSVEGAGCVSMPVIARQLSSSSGHGLRPRSGHRSWRGRTLGLLGQDAEERLRFNRLFQVEVVFADDALRIAGLQRRLT